MSDAMSEGARLQREALERARAKYGHMKPDYWADEAALVYKALLSKRGDMRRLEGEIASLEDSYNLLSRLLDAQ